MDPIGREVASAGRAISRAFSAALADAGGSLPMWLVLLSLKRQRWRTQHELAHAVGIESPTLTRHLDNLEKAGLVTRSRDPADRRVIRIDLTSAGEAMFVRLRKAAGRFDRQLREGVSDAELEQLRRVLDRLTSNVDGSDGPMEPALRQDTVPDA